MKRLLIALTVLISANCFGQIPFETAFTDRSTFTNRYKFTAEYLINAQDKAQKDIFKACLVIESRIIENELIESITGSEDIIKRNEEWLRNGITHNMGKSVKEEIEQYQKYIDSYNERLEKLRALTAELLAL